MADSNNVIFEPKIGDTGSVVKDIDNLIKSLQTLHDSVVTIKKTQSAGGIGKTLEADAATSTKAAQTISKAYDKIIESDKKARKIVKVHDKPESMDEAIKYYDAINIELGKTNDLLSDQGNIVASGKNALGSSKGIFSSSARSEARGEAKDKKKKTIESKYADASEQISTLASTLDVLTQKTALGKMKLFDLSNTLNDLGESSGDVSVTVGDLLEAFTSGFDDAEQSFKKIGDWRQRLEKLSSGISTWSKGVSAANSAIVKGGGELSKAQKIMGGLASSSGTLTKVLGGASKALGVAGVAVAGFVAGFQIFDKLMGRSAEDIEKRIDALKDAATAETERAKLIREGSVDSVERSIESLQDEIHERQRYAEELRNNAVENTDTFSQIRTVLGHGLGDPTVYGATGDELNNVNDEIKKMQDELEKLNDDGFRAAIERANEYNEALKQQEEVARDVERQEDELLTLRMNIAKSQSNLIKELQDVDEEYDSDLAADQERRHDEELDRVRDHLNDLQNRQDEFNINEERERRDHLLSLQKIDSDFYEKEEEAREEHEKDLIELAQEYHEEEMQSEEDYREESQKSREQYEKRIAKMEEDYNKAKIKRQKDLQYALFEAELDNDALSFFKLMRENEKQAKEEEEAHQDELLEEKKTYEEDRAETQKQHDKDRADRLEEYQKQRAEKMEEYAKDREDAKAQHEQELLEERQAYAEAQKERQYQYQQELNDAVEAYEKRTAELKAQYAEEDALRQEQRAKKRQELLDQFDEELEYFEQRESLLLGYINDFQRLKRIYESREIQQGEQLTSSEVNDVLSSISREVNRLNSIENRSTEETQMLQALTDAATQLRTGLDSDQLFDTARLTQSQIEDINSAVSRGLTDAVVNLENEYGDRVKYSAEDYEAFQRSNIGLGRSLVGDLQDTTNTFFQDMGYNATQSGYETTRELEEQRRRQLIINQQYGTDTLDQLQDQADQENQTISVGFHQLDNTRRQHTIDEMRALDQKYYDEDQTRSGYYDQQQQGLDQAISDNLTRQQEGHESESIATDEFYNQSQDTLLNYHGAQIDAGEQHSQDMLNSENAYHADSLNQTEQFSENMSDELASGYNDTINDIHSESVRAANLIVTVYQQMNNAIIQHAQQSTAALRQTSGGNASWSGYNSIRSSISSALSSGSARRRVVSSGVRRGLLAAEGAFIDKPTSVIAGEGKQPEVIFPFDKSAGIPDNILRSMGKGFYDNLRESTIGLHATRGSDQTTRELARAISNIKPGMKMQIGDVSIGSDISRNEILSQFTELQKALIDIFSGSVN